MMPESRVAPPATVGAATQLARQLYGVHATARLLPGEFDDNFHLQLEDGRECVLKIMHPFREESFVDMQCRALTHLAEKSPKLLLPSVVRNLQGESYSQVRLEDGTDRLVWLLNFLPGTVLAEANPRSAELLESLGKLLAEMDLALLDFAHPAAARDLKWDITRSLWARDFLSSVQDTHRRKLVETFLTAFEQEVLPRLARLRRTVIYGDANDYNVLVSAPWPQPRQVIGVIDFGDMHETITVAEVAIAAAYALLGQDDPLKAVSAVLAGYNKILPLTEEELTVLFFLIAARLAVSVVNSANRQTLLPEDAYVTVTTAPAWEALERLAKIHPRLAEYTFRAACGISAVPQAAKVAGWLKRNADDAAKLVPQIVEDAAVQVLDLSVGGALLPANPAELTEPNLTNKLQQWMATTNANAAIGRYDEARPLYLSPSFGESSKPTDERRTIHLGIDLFVESGTPISAPFDGTVHAFANNKAALDYGPVVILRHAPDAGIEFFTLYGHLSEASLLRLSLGQKIEKRSTFAQVGNARENGGWTPHLHFQIILDLLDLGTDFPGVGFASERAVWKGLSPDPNLILGVPGDRFPEMPPPLAETLALRRTLLGQNLSISYRRPLKIVRGWRQYLYDDAGRAYLDVYNNVPLVGHSHPRVVRSVQEQLAVLNTNTRYLHDNANRYAERLIGLLPAPLRVCYFLNSGSEANELALRLAGTHTGREDVIVLEHAYHGHTTTLIDISPYKFAGPGGRGQKPWVHVAPIADDFRGMYRRGEADLGKKYAAHVGEICEKLKGSGRGLAAYIAETLPSVAGQIVFPPNYLEEAYQHVRAAGGVCIADEVQVGFGRLGTHFWGFETQGVVPDIVVLGKPIGNAFPLAAVVTTAEIAESFNNGMEFFTTFGGSPVACAAGMAVLAVLHDEMLQQNALKVGGQWITELKALQGSFPIIGDVRGSGLFLGIDFVNSEETRAAAPDQASYVVERLRDLGILAGVDGPHHNVIKLRPPLIFSEADVKLFSVALTSILEEDASRPSLQH
ncbi:MAG TPA: aminotransferase class III-fold pyridoxal phosphate-dependent enzyme [Candidatus Acidoferrum sp.]|nr:aminotransferase class III-fold pyridoxal phosphate-dependent enzyme [Candidatus Acidoferrum sp.]